MKLLKMSSFREWQITYHFNSIRIIEAYGNIFDFDTRDYEVFLNDENDFWLEGKKVFTDSEDKNILLKIENNLYKLLELKF